MVNSLWLPDAEGLLLIRFKVAFPIYLPLIRPLVVLMLLFFCRSGEHILMFDVQIKTVIIVYCGDKRSA